MQSLLLGDAVMTNHPHGLVAVVWTAATAALLVVATILIFLPETRTPALKAALVALWTPQSVACLWTSYKTGMLKMSMRELYRMGNKPKTDLLSWAAIMMGSAALVVAL